MTSELKSATARANGAKSRGPKTAATRAKSARNSLGHGLTARNTIVLQCELPGEYQKMMADFDATYLPATPAQKNLVDEMAAARWRLDRLCVVETALIDDEMDRMSALPGNSADTGIRLARAFRSLADNSRSLALVRRYQSTLHRTFEKAYSTLRELQQQPETKTPVPEPPSDAQVEPAQPDTAAPRKLKIVPARQEVADRSVRNEPNPKDGADPDFPGSGRREESDQEA